MTIPPYWLHLDKWFPLMLFFLLDFVRINKFLLDRLLPDSFDPSCVIRQHSNAYNIRYYIVCGFLTIFYSN